MRKVLTILVIVFIILSVSGEMLVPRFASGLIREYLVQKLATESVEVDVSSTPSFNLLTGQLDKANAAAKGAKLGKLYVDNLSLTGENVKLALPSLAEFNGARISSADKLVLTGTVTEENLRTLIVSEVPKLDNVAVTITPEAVVATAQAKVFGRVAEIELEGTVVDSGRELYFRLTRVNVLRTSLGRSILGDFFSDILLVKLDALPPEVQFDEVVQQPGQVVIAASWHNE